MPQVRHSTRGDRKAMKKEEILSEQEKRELRGFIDHWRKHGEHQVFADKAIKHIEEIFRPHLRGEFPRVAMEKLLQALVWSVTHGCTEWAAIEAALGDLERLLTDEVPVGTCPTCGGSGGKCLQPSQGCASIHVQSKGHCFHCNFWQPCPDCTEQYTFLREDGLKYPDHRKGQQRKIPPKITEGTNLVCIGFTKDFEKPIYTEDQRTGDDRRSETLTGSLKAMRPQE